MGEKLISSTITSLPEIVDITINDEQFNLLSMLVDICCTFQASSADCERGFSLINNIEVQSRNRLGNTHLDDLMRIKLYLNAGRTVDLQKRILCGKSKKSGVKRFKVIITSVYK